MSESKSTIVYVTAGIQKLTQDARRSLVRNLEHDRKLSDGFTPEHIGQAQVALQPSNSFSMPVGWIGMVVINNNGTHLCRSYAIAGGNLDDERVQAIALRTALLVTYCARDITVYMSVNTVPSMFVDSATGEVGDMWINEDWELVGSSVDTLKECGRIVKVRDSHGKKTKVSLGTLQGYSNELREMVTHTTAVERGVVNTVLYASPLNSSDGCAKRLMDAALQVGITLDPMGKRPSTPNAAEANSNQNYINDVINSAAADTDKYNYHVGDPSLCLICSSCMNVVKVTYHGYADVLLYNAVVTTCCSSCMTVGEAAVKLKPVLIKRLTSYDLIRKECSARTVIASNLEYVKHVNINDVFKAVTKDHSIAMLDYDRGVMGELRGGFF